MDKIAIDLIWVRPGKSGGVESYIRNILDGFAKHNTEYEFYLFLANDNYESFAHYANNKKFHLVKTDAYSEKSIGRNIWENIYLGKELRKRNISLCFEPVYSKPVFGVHNIRFITAIMDLNQLHFPQNYAFYKPIIIKQIWKNTIKSSHKIVTISEFVKSDIIKNFSAAPDKIQVVYIPIEVDTCDSYTAEDLGERYGLGDGTYDYTVSSMLPHKNLETILEAFHVLKDKGKLERKLVISGVGGASTDTIQSIIKSYGLEEDVLITGYIENKLRNTLYKYCKLFLFPSIFEGFGMPPIEAMQFGKPVITTSETSIPEVTQGKAYYVQNPYDVNEWVTFIENPPTQISTIDMQRYSEKKIVEDYFRLFKECSDISSP